MGRVGNIHSSEERLVTNEKQVVVERVVAHTSTLSIKHSASQARTHYWGLDHVRVLATFMVLYRHMAEVFDKLGLPLSVWGLDIGQVGVTLFCVVSGFLVVNGNRPPGKWLLSRAVRIFPTLWLVTLVSIVGAMATGYKPIHVGYLIMQLVGLGYFVPPALCLNVVVWFITLIMFCYMIALPVRLAKGSPLASWSIWAIFTVLLVAFSGQIMIVHIVSFTVGMLAATMSRDIQNWAVVPLLVLGAVSWAIPTAHYSLLGTACLYLAMAVPVRRVNRVTAWIAQYSYEVFLLHGLFLIFFARILDWPVAVAAPLFVIASAAASIPLKWASSRISRPLDPWLRGLG